MARVHGAFVYIHQRNQEAFSHQPLRRAPFARLRRGFLYAPTPRLFARLRHAPFVSLRHAPFARLPGPRRCGAGAATSAPSTCSRGGTARRCRAHWRGGRRQAASGPANCRGKTTVLRLRATSTPPVVKYPSAYMRRGVIKSNGTSLAGRPSASSIWTCTSQRQGSRFTA